MSNNNIKTYKINCAHCGKEAIRKSKMAIYCDDFCKKRAYEKRKGIEAPGFLKKIEKNKIKQTLKFQKLKSNPQQLTFREPSAELEILKQHRRYWREVLNDARQGVYSFGKILGGGIGVASAENTEEKIVNGLIGGVVGNLFDNWSRKVDIKNAETAIRNLTERIDNLERASKLVSTGKIFTRKKDRVRFTSSTIKSSQEYRKEVIKTLGFDGAYKYLMGDPQQNFYVVLTGAPGNGKSTFAVKFANYFQKKFGDVLFLAAEQSGTNLSLQKLLERNDAKFDIETKPRAWGNEEWEKAANHYKLIIIDSATVLDLTPIQVEGIREKAPNTAFLVVLQSTKEGTYKGSTQWKHDCWTFLKAEDMVIYQTKCRDTQPAHVEVQNL